MNIRQIIEKYRKESTITIPSGTIIQVQGIVPADFPALESDLSAAMQEQAGLFAQWAADLYYYAGKQRWIDSPGSTNAGITTSELYTRFLFQQWADREGYMRKGSGWALDNCKPISESQLMEQFKKSV